MTDGSAVDFEDAQIQELTKCGAAVRLTKRGHCLSRRGIIASIAAALLLAAGCGALRPPAPLDTYELSAADASSAGRRSNAQILIAEPAALKALDGQDIVIKPSSGIIQYLKGAQWADRLPKIIQARLAETFQRSGKFKGVGRPGEGLAIDYQVITEIRAFDIDVSGIGRAHVEFFVKILDDRNGTVRKSKVFETSATVSGMGNDAYVAALDRAFNEAASQIIDWTESTI